MRACSGRRSRVTSRLKVRLRAPHVVVAVAIRSADPSALQFCLRRHAGENAREKLTPRQISAQCASAPGSSGRRPCHRLRDGERRLLAGSPQNGGAYANSKHRRIDEILSHYCRHASCPRLADPRCYGAWTATAFRSTSARLKAARSWVFRAFGNGASRALGNGATPGPSARPAVTVQRPRYWPGPNKQGLHETQGGSPCPATRLKARRCASITSCGMVPPCRVRQIRRPLTRMAGSASMR